MKITKSVPRPMIKKVVLGFAGPICAGKDILVEKLATYYLQSGFNVSIVKNSELLKDIFTALSIQPSRHDYSNLTTALKRIFGHDIISRTTAKYIMYNDFEVVLWSGLRTEDDWEQLFEMNGNLVFVNADVKVRYARLLSRNRDKGDRSKSLTEFLEDECLPTEANIYNLEKKASLTLINEGSIDGVYNTLLNYTNSVVECLQSRE